LTARTLIIAGEGPDDFEQLRADLMAEHHPQTMLGRELVERVAVICWRLRRVPTFEAAVLAACHAEALDKILSFQAMREVPEGEFENWETSVRLGEALIEDARSHHALGQIVRHETSLMNALSKTLHMLLLVEDTGGGGDHNVAIARLQAIPLSSAA
jgi:hypothetical protein